MYRVRGRRVVVKVSLVRRKGGIIVVFMSWSDVKFVIPHAHAFVCASTPKDNVYVCMCIGM